jgi:hypothetical protein
MVKKVGLIKNIRKLLISSATEASLGLDQLFFKYRFYLVPYIAGARPAGSGSGQPRPGDPYEYSGPNRDVTKYPVFAERGGGDRGFDRGGGYERGYRQAAQPPSRRDPFPPPGRMRGNAGGIDSFSGRPIITYRDWDAPNDDYF